MRGSSARRLQAARWLHYGFGLAVLSGLTLHRAVWWRLYAPARTATPAPAWQVASGTAQTG
jgi:cytochrome b561